METLCGFLKKKILFLQKVNIKTLFFNNKDYKTKDLIKVKFRIKIIFY